MSARGDALAVVKRLRDAGHVAYFAGGCVRDELLGLSPEDYDVATDATPDLVRRLFRRTQAVGAAFGVILVKEGGSQIEVATFRADETYDDGRHPSAVRFTSAEEDARRRDFTINGLYLDPLDGDKVIDFVGGRDDLSAKILRSIGEPKKRFDEDYLRMLRAPRFASRFGLTIDAGTREAIRANAPRLAAISPERINDELQRMLTPAKSRAAAWRMLWDLKLLPVIFRFLNASTVEPTRAMLFEHVSPGKDIDAPLALAAAGICYRRQTEKVSGTFFSPPEVKRLVGALRKALRLSNEDTDGIAGCLNVAVMLASPPASLRVAAIKRFLAQPHSEGARALLAALSKVDAGFASIWPALSARFDEFKGVQVAPPPLVTGDDLVAAGQSPGPAFKKALAVAYDEQLEGRVTDRAAALEFALKQFTSK